MDRLKVFAHHCRVTLPWAAVGGAALTIAYLTGDFCYAVGRFVAD